MRDKSLDKLNPIFRTKVEAMMALLKGSCWHWTIFESWRPPATKHKKSKFSMTNPFVNPSKHGAGWAVDVLPFGNWNGPWKHASHPSWDELREAAHAVGLSNDIKWDRAHVDVSRDTIIREMQKLLCTTVDGKWGRKTTAAAMRWAKYHDVEWMKPVPRRYAKIHPTTYRRLFKYLARNT